MLNNNITDFRNASAAVRTALTNAGRGLVEREALVELVALAAVAREHILVIGPPGTAKSEAVRRVARVLGGVYFEYLLGRFTEPSEIFGPVDLRKLKEGLVETETVGMLPEAEIAFLDEIFQGSTAILNTLLGLLNERVFRRGHTRMTCPLRVCVGASNALPEDESLAAFADRFLVRMFVEPIPDPLLERLLEGGWTLGQSPLSDSISLSQIDLLSQTADAADVSLIRPTLAQAVRILRGAGVVLSDRRIVKAQKLCAAAAALAGRVKPSEADLWPLIYAVPTGEQQALARECLRDLLAASENATLPTAAEDASQGPMARATRLARAAQEILQARPGPHDEAGQKAWRLRLEGLAREIDAGFAPEELPQILMDVRIALIGYLGTKP